jgi:hypothetical protein
MLDTFVNGLVAVVDTLYEAAFLVYERFYHLDQYLHDRPY